MAHYDVAEAIPDWGVWGTLRHVIDGPVQGLNNRGYDVTLPDYNADPSKSAAWNTSAIQAAIDDADAEGTAHSTNHDTAAPGETITVYCPPGVYPVTGLDLDGKNVNLVGAGPAATRFRADPSITGYVISMDGWAGRLAHARGSSPFGGFSIEGTHTAGATLGGLYIANTQVHMADVSIFGTGGPAMKVGSAVHLSHFDRITLQRPTGADSNDVPYLHVFGPHNGNTWDRLGLTNVSGSPDGTKVVFMEKDGAQATQTLQRAEKTEFRSPWTEFMRTPSGGAVFWIEAARILIDSPQNFDQTPEASPASPHCLVKFTENGVNEYRGRVPGDESWSYGVIVETDGCRITGIRGFQNNNVYLAAGVGYTFVELGGADSTPGATPWVDDSGTATNTLIDHNARLWKPGAASYTTS